MGASENTGRTSKYELEQLTTESELTGEDETLGQPAIEKPTETPEKD